MTYYFQGIAPDVLNLKTKKTEKFLLIQDILFNFFTKITILPENLHKKSKIWQWQVIVTNSSGIENEKLLGWNRK